MRTCASGRSLRNAPFPAASGRGLRRGHPPAPGLPLPALLAPAGRGLPPARKRRVPPLVSAGRDTEEEAPNRAERVRPLPPRDGLYAVAKGTVDDRAPLVSTGRERRWKGFFPVGVRGGALAEEASFFIAGGGRGPKPTAPRGGTASPYGRAVVPAARKLFRLTGRPFLYVRGSFGGSYLGRNDGVPPHTRGPRRHPPDGAARSSTGSEPSAFARSPCLWVSVFLRNVPCPTPN